jgi:hypothetical protein
LLLLLALLAACAQHVAARNFYDLLNVPQGASDQQIKRSYRKLALKFHPDKVCTHSSWRLTQHYYSLQDCTQARYSNQQVIAAAQNAMGCVTFSWLCMSAAGANSVKAGSSKSLLLLLLSQSSTALQQLQAVLPFLCACIS